MTAARSSANFVSRGASGNFDFNFFNKYATLDHYLSRGSSGNVFGPIKWNKTQLAIKQTTFANSKVNDKLKKDMEANRDIWTSLENKNIIRIYSVDLRQLPKAMFIVMEFAAGGSLKDILQSLGSETKLPIDVVRDWTKQVAEGMVYLHEKNIVHRDLKSSNILLMEPFNDRHPHTMISLKIADFDEVRDHDHTTTMSFVGTFAYMAPEIILGERFSKTSDVWSYGVVVWEMLSGDIPHKGLEPQTIMYKLIHGELDNLPIEKSVPEDYQLLLKNCWKSAHEERPSFQDIFCILNISERYKSGPVLIDTITKESTEGGIASLTILDKELFVVNERNSEVEVYDSIKISFSRRWKLQELNNPMDIVSCNINKCLYVFDSKGQGQSSKILKVDANGNLLRKWSTGRDWGCCLSVTEQSNIILTCYNESKLIEFLPDGRLIRVIDLADAGIRCPYHAIKLTDGNFVVSYGSDGRAIVGLCVVNADGNLIKSFNGTCGKKVITMNIPIYLSVDKNGFVLVVDKWNRRVLLLDSDLKFYKEILSKEKHDLNDLSKILVDETSGRMFVADYELFKYERILIFHFCTSDDDIIP